MVPEIGLTPQALKRFELQLDCLVVAQHSRLSPTEKAKVWSNAQSNHPLVIIGTRSALFIPFSNLKLIIIDECHDLSFKQQTNLRYHARDSAIMRAKISNIPIILGSATPSLETLHNVNQGKFHVLRLTSRVGGGHSPKIQLIDTRQHPSQKGISHLLMSKIKEHLNSKGQILLFINRRGYSPCLVCPSCDHVIHCHRCDRAMTLHLTPYHLSCHLCGHRRQPPSQCPECHSTEPWLQLGTGTEKIESLLQQQFPHHKTVRIDRSTTSSRHQLAQQLDKIHEMEADILVGTQMIAKGHDFKNITLVGIIDIDPAFYSHDFRALEHCFQLITQVAGRAGRHGSHAEVLIQTQFPEHSHLNQLLEKNYHQFSQTLLAERKTLNLPPFSHIALIHARAKNKQQCHAFLNKIKANTHNLASQANVEVLGPADSIIAKEKGDYRSQLYLQSTDRQGLHQVLQAAQQLIKQEKMTTARWSIDVDPVSLA